MAPRRRQQDQRNNYHHGDVSDGTSRKNCCCCNFSCWSCFAHLITCCVPPFVLKCCGMEEKEVRQAFREKIALCFIILFMCFLLGFLTFGLGFVLCPKHDPRPRIPIKELRLSPDGKRTWMQGYVFDAKEVAKALKVPQKDIANQDSGYRFPPSINFCRGVFKNTYVPRCEKESSCLDRNQLYFMVSPFKKVIYDWKEVQAKKTNYIVYDGEVWDLSELLDANDNWFADEGIGKDILSHLGKDVSAAMARRGSAGRRAAECLSSWFKVGDLSTHTMGCVTYNIIVFLSMLAVTALILTKFFMAVTFSWFISRKLDRMQKDQEDGIDDGVVFRQEVPQIVTQSIRATLGVPSVLGLSTREKVSSSRPFVMLMVTCYSENESSIRATLDSLASTDYPDSRKMLFIVADGLVTGSGNWTSTPELILRMLHIDESMGAPKAHVYSAVSEGAAGINMAKVFVGVYGYKGRSVPTVLVVKCGLPSEEMSQKPGNRGKRDSQMILMNFLQRVIFNESMTALEYDLFNKIYWLMGVPPDYFDIVLMVDADTRVAVDSLGRMVNAMMRDPKVIGLCGETRIANKGQSWVTAIQVFEYYISHHLGKAFESVFGGVTCLPGCFSMYRIKVAKNGQWVPILVSPAVTEEYSQKTVNTLHKKNLLLLGEDRFLTTLMIKTFPKRKMIFVPQAYCKTIVPHEFKVLLSQRRRWINSTIHNLMELVLVNDLCGTFCFSMQFVVLMELIGNVVLPAAIVFTGVLLATAFVNPLNAVLPLILLVLVLGLPAVLIVITTKNLLYLIWMVIYLLALPLWNFILPLYAFWHFDDFTWGHTRKLCDKEKDNGGKEMAENDDEMDSQNDGQKDAISVDGTVVNNDKRVPGLDPTNVPMKTWIAWTRYYIKLFNGKNVTDVDNTVE